MAKRSIIAPERLEKLKLPQAVYIISCNDEYECNHHQGCTRGFFSLYLQVVYGIVFAKKMGVKYNVDFGNIKYAYTDKKINESNFWNYYFEQEKFGGDIEKVFNLANENYPLRIWNRSHYKKLNEQGVSALHLKKEITDRLSEIKRSFSGVKVLGIHVRRTDHFHETKPMENDSYFKAVNKWIDKYDKVFVATDDKEVLNDFLSRYPNKIIHNDTIQSSGELSIHYDLKTDDRYKLGEDALIECYSLSFCDRVILSPSNLSYAALVINPALKYEIIESVHAWRKRWKTLIVFYLDRWKIRKW